MNTSNISLAFTLCSNNYLAQAKTLGDSFLKYHPESEFVIGLVDQYSSDVDYQLFANFTLVEVSEIDIPDFDKLKDQFNIVELNTAVKPFYFSFLFNTKKAKKVIYLDPDIVVFSRFMEVSQLLDDYNIVVTPQLCEPVDDGHHPIDQDLLVTGTFNLGFIALSDYTLVRAFLKWWSERVVKYGYGRPESHMFYDQLLINLVPAFFDNYYVLRHKGYNMAGWNLYERTITEHQDEAVVINKNIPLRFFHFSGYKFNKPDVICNYNSRYNFDTRPDVRRIFNDYHQSVSSNHYAVLSKIEPVYKKKELENSIPEISLTAKINHRLKRTIRVFLGYE